MKVRCERHRIFLEAENDFERQAIQQAISQGVQNVMRDPATAWDPHHDNDALILELRDPDKW